MIRHFERAQPLEPADKQRMQWGAALGAGFIAGLILVVVPRGSPWSSLTFFSPVIMGRGLSPFTGLPLVAIWLCHLAVSIVYGLIIAKIINNFRQFKAILTGGLVGLVLYLINFGIISTLWSDLRGNEVSVLFTHVVFGLLAAGAYRGLLSRRTVPTGVQ
jgi:hypothetical protein